MTRGIFLVAFGKPGYIYAAYNFAVSVKHYNPDIQIAIFHDDCINHLQEFQKEVFDIFISIPDDVKMPQGVTNPGRVKTSIYGYLPFDSNLVLDVDAMALKDIAPMFEQLESAGGYYYSHLQGTHKIAQGNIMPHLIWAFADDVWQKFNFTEETVLPCVNSSFQYIKKCDQAKELFEQINKNFDDPIPLNKLRTQWGANQPDELYIDVALAQCEINPQAPGNYLFFGNTLHNELPTRQLDKSFYILSLFGNRAMIRPKYKEFYDVRMIEIFSSMKMRHLFKLPYITRDKHANIRPVAQRPQGMPTRDLTLKKALNPISQSIEIDHTKLIQAYPSPAGRNIQVTNWFNCSFIKFKGKTYLAYRMEGKPFCVNIKLGICLLDEFMQPIRESNVLLDLHSDLKGMGGKPYAKGFHVEDPRLFIFNDDLYLSYCDGYQMGQAKIDPETRQATESFYLDKPVSGRTEKNWTFFQSGKKLLSVYNSNPHTIFEMDGAKHKEIYSHLWKNDWNYGEIRGGTSPILIGDRFISFFHSSLPISLKGHQGRQYFMGAYEFESVAPYRPIRITKEPIISGEVIDFNIPRLSNLIYVVFPAGAIRQDNGWLISYGYNDYRCHFHEITDVELESNMVELENLVEA
jgi:predicted GH43/DUF377 family glycosyl hydrolase